jgi:prophage antirepressor-like protein
MIRFLIRSHSLRAGLTEQQARDILWSLTSRDLYRMLVRDRGWTAQEFEAWLANMLVDALIG